MIWRAIQLLIGIFNLSVLIIGLYIFLHGGGLHLQGQQGLEYKDFVSILLTALAVMIAVLTVFIAAAAFWGFSAIKDEARQIAMREARLRSEEVAVRSFREFWDQTIAGLGLGRAYGQRAGEGDV